MMRKIYAPVLMGCLFAVMFGCSHKKPNNIIITKKVVDKKQSNKVNVMSAYRDSVKTEWLGSHYVIKTASSIDSSDVVVTSNGSKYYDNRISLKVIRPDGSTFFSRTFAKSDFRKFIDNNYYDRGALLGIVFDKTDGKSLYFAASVGSPAKLSDEYVPLILKIDNLGNVSIDKDRSLDMNRDGMSMDEMGD